MRQLTATEVVAPAAVSKSASTTYLLVEALVALFAGAAAFGIAAIGTMMWAYFVPFHITHGPPVLGSVGNASS